MNLEIIIRRTISIILFLILLFIVPITIFEFILYIFRYMITKTKIPPEPYAFIFIKRMW